MDRDKRDGIRLRMRHQSKPTDLTRRSHRTLAAVATAVALGLAVGPALAETVPLPRPAPRERDAAAKSGGDVTGTPMAGTQTPARPAAPTTPLPGPPARAATGGNLRTPRRSPAAGKSS